MASVHPPVTAVIAVTLKSKSANHSTGHAFDLKRSVLTAEGWEAEANDKIVEGASESWRKTSFAAEAE
jgi:hypothetical protein